MGDGWAAWDTPRAAAPSVPTLQSRYCPRCDRMTAWTPGGNPAHPTLPACECGVTVATEHSLDELDNLRRHYRLSTADLDNMVGLPTPERI